ncbi:neuronal tyrosine-phosphorylated phosphoinositide-3-kinase adapter 2 [Sardina pilchardus]|uniref:neuronal tyrosine-phosphorylated phosphoinositide-3-kinase adapter 2 n=1 Tax=Sardina pilchardus TaxID=27697 RepID=UPI002E150CFC
MPCGGIMISVVYGRAALSGLPVSPPSSGRVPLLGPAATAARPHAQLSAMLVGEDVVTEGKHLRIGSMTMPAPPERVAHPSCGPGFAVRSQSLHSVGGGGDEDGSPTSRKQPPPKPRRDPNTKLSISSETVDLASSTCRSGDPDRCDGKWEPNTNASSLLVASQGCSEDCRRVPPPKPKRNPNTQLSTSFDESYIRSHSSKGSPPASRESLAPSPPEPQSPPGRDSDSDEPVYIEMTGSAAREAQRSEDDEPGEAVYEEMKYPALDELLDYPSGYRSQCATPCPSEPGEQTPLSSRCSTPRGTPLCDIPAPFPNLLTHRPPLLVFPPAPAQCSPNSDESPLTPLDMAKLPMLENASYSKSPTSSSGMEHPGSSSASSSSSSHQKSRRERERELTATPTITVSGRSSAPPLPCTLYKSSASSHGYQRSHSACPSPVSMGRCLTPLSLMRAPPFDGPFPGAGLPRSASATPHGKGSPPQEGGGRLHGSMQNVSVGRSRTPTSPLDELTNLFTTGRNMLKKNTSGRKSKEPGESESKGRCHSSETKKEGKDRHHKESKRDSKERHSSSKESRRDSKDRSCNGIEPMPRRDSKDKTGNVSEALHRQDSKDRIGNNVDIFQRRDSKDRGNTMSELLPRRDSKDRGCNGIDCLPRQDSKEMVRNGAETRRDGKDRGGHVAEGMSRHESKESVRNGLEVRRNSKEGGRKDSESRREWDCKERSSTDTKRESKDRGCNSADFISRRDFKDRVGHVPEPLPRNEGKDRANHSAETTKTNEWEGLSGPPAIGTPSRLGRSCVSPTMVLGNTSSELKTAQKMGRSPSTPVAPSPLGTPQRQPQEPLQSQMPPMPWVYGDSTMMDMIERKQRLCREIRSRQQQPPPPQRPPVRSPCKQESLPALPGWKKSNGAKKYGPPPYPSQTTVFWDTAI